MAYIGESFRIHYIAKDFKTGLSDVLLYVFKPNGAKLGPYLLSELYILPSSGIYFCDFLDSDIGGTYLFLIDSASCPLRDAKQVYFKRNIEEDLSLVKNKTDQIVFLDSRVLSSLDGEKVFLNDESCLVLKTILGLSQHNYRVYNSQYDSNGKLIYCLVKLYNNKEDLVLDINPFKIYKMIAEYNNSGLMLSYRMEEQ